VIEKKEIRQSTTDPECGFMSRENIQEMFCYPDHRTTDMKFNIITDAFATPGNVKSGKVFYKFRKEKVERSFADSKELHGLRYCRLLGCIMRVSKCYSPQHAKI
jgi:hypothetical protein